MTRAVALAPDADFEAWRAAVRGPLRAGAPPQAVVFASETDDLFAPPAVPEEAGAPARMPAAFVALARDAAEHSDPGRFALLYRLAFRVRADPRVLQDASDPDQRAAERLARAVRRDRHKMTAFVRFRAIAEAGGERFLAWYEPDHYIVRSTAAFFVRRFAAMRWSILTPRLSVVWDGAELCFGPGGDRAQAPREDACEEDWRTYYASIFNPARLNLAAMRKEMPKKRWRNLPEASLLADLTAAAAARTDAMLDAKPERPRKRAGAAHAALRPAARAAGDLRGDAEPRPAPQTLPSLAAALQACRACPLWADATQAVPGEGPGPARLLLVGEQPGDQEDLAGRPFVGPAGKVLDRALAAAGIARAEAYVTNAVKHFKHEPRGRMRLHKRPDRGEVEACRWWLDREIALVRPELIVALGATAAFSLLGHTGALKDVRGAIRPGRGGARVLATIHPSYLLRLPDEAAKRAEFDRFVADLRLAA